MHVEMAPITEPSFAALVGALGRDEFEAFVVDLLEAQGREVAIDDGFLIVGGGSPDERVLYVDHHARPRLRAFLGASGVRTRSVGDREIDAVVTNRRGAVVTGVADDAEVDVIDADDLRRRALFGIDRGACDDLFRKHFDRPIGAFASDSRGGRGALRLRIRTLATDTVEAGLPRPLAASVVVIGLLLAAAVVGASFVSDPAGVEAGDTGATTGLATPPATPAPTVSGGEVTATDGAQSDRFPPGLSADGVTDPEALARAHAGALSGRSYTLTITFEKRALETTRTRRRETVRVASSTVYVSEVDGSPSTGNPIDPVANVSTYADGTVRYERFRRDGRTRYRVRPIRDSGDGHERFLDRATRDIEWLLSARETAIERRFEWNDRRVYVVVGIGDPTVRGENAVTTAVVDSTGVVRRIERVYRVPEYGPQRHTITVTISLRYEAIGETVVRPPAWYGHALNATGT